ncbi:response regulator [Chloroflexota bacterium]
MYNRAGKVLVVDHEESVRSLVQQVLKKASYEVVTVANGQEALYMVGQGDIGIVLLDIQMSGLSDMEALQNLATDRFGIFIIVMTVVTDTENAVEAMKLGAYDCIIKPFKRVDLVFRVQRAIQRRNLKLQSEQHRILLEEKVRERRGQLQGYFGDLMYTLTLEYNRLSARSMKRSRRSGSPFSKLSPELKQSIGFVEESGDTLLRIQNSNEAILSGWTFSRW